MPREGRGRPSRLRDWGVQRGLSDRHPRRLEHWPARPLPFAGPPSPLGIRLVGSTAVPGRAVRGRCCAVVPGTP